jgi:hypothetical protein
MHRSLHQVIHAVGSAQACRQGLCAHSSKSEQPSQWVWSDTLSLSEKQVQQGLNLLMRLKSPAQMPALLAGIRSLQPLIDQALTSLHYVHFARFLPTMDGSALWVITVFDGDLQSYLMDFVKVLGEPFNIMLSFVADAPRLPVQQYPRDFCDWVNRNNVVQAQPWSAYKDLTCIDIQAQRRHV